MKPVAGLDVKTLRVKEITVDLAASEAPKTLTAHLHKALTSNLDYCAKGTIGVDLAVRIDNFKRANPVAVMLVGDATNLAGSVKLSSANGGTQNGEYYVEVGTGGGGLIGLAATSDPEGDLSDKFARRVCAEVFQQEPEPQELPKAGLTAASDDDGN